MIRAGLRNVGTSYKEARKARQHRVEESINYEG